MGIPLLDCFSFCEDFFTFCVLAFLRLKVPLLALYLRLKALAPIVEKLAVRLLLAALMAVIMRISAKIPSAIIITVMAVRNLLPLTFFHDNDSESLYVIGFVNAQR